MVSRAPRMPNSACFIFFCAVDMIDHELTAPWPAACCTETLAIVLYACVALLARIAINMAIDIHRQTQRYRLLVHDIDVDFTMLT